MFEEQAMSISLELSPVSPKNPVLCHFKSFYGGNKYCSKVVRLSVLAHFYTGLRAIVRANPKIEVLQGYYYSIFLSKGF